MSVNIPVKPEFNLEKSLTKLFFLGQTYWQQADSEFVSKHKKSDETYKKYEDLKAEILNQVKELE